MRSSTRTVSSRLASPRDAPDSAGEAPVRPPTLADLEASLVGLASDEDPALGLVGVMSLRQEADVFERYQVARARAAGWTWAQIGAALEVSAQAVHKKHARRLSASQG